MSLTRAEREKQTYDEQDSHRLHNRRLHGRLSHLRGSPNMRRGMALFDDLLVEAAQDADVLEIGCGNGWQSERILELGARTVHGMDISTSMLKTAKKRETERLRFFEHDVHQQWPKTYDVICGRAILHHVDYREALENLYHNNLRPGGHMLFLEPLGENILLKLYWRFGTSFHTPDERPFMRDDLDWMNKNFQQFRLYSLNYLSIPAAIVSSFAFASSDNWLLRLCDRLDTKLSAVPFLASRFQSGIFHIRKPST
jgi:SAM-dependent methyltransferase